ncbi:SixA phosphatase family protein [Parasediminibacterium paludis]|uniref:SixA phosphatase family protein n=1 Tax=Parasediminibacterium paludis TaxID=908966 RepID=A0ABV8PY68_9BACT
MKQLLVIRHAKSSWDVTALSDVDRQLNERGHNNAPMMAKRLLDKQITINAFVSSTAVRALTTAIYFAATYQYSKNSILQIDELYNATAETIFKVVTSLPNTIETAAVFAHNPGITDFANMLTTTQIDNMPTCGIFAVKAQCKDWADFRKAKKDFWFFDYPKNL